MDAEQKSSDHIPNDVIEAILNHIPFDGWSTASLDMAAADCGLSEVEMHSLFPAGIVDAIAAYGAYAPVAAAYAWNPAPWDARNAAVDFSDAEAAGQDANVVSTVAVGPTRKLVLQTCSRQACRSGWLEAAGQDANVVSTVAVGPNRKLVLQT